MLKSCSPKNTVPLSMIELHSYLNRVTSRLVPFLCYELRNIFLETLNKSYQFMHFLVFLKRLSMEILQSFFGKCKYCLDVCLLTTLEIYAHLFHQGWKSCWEEKAAGDWEHAIFSVNAGVPITSWCVFNLKSTSHARQHISNHTYVLICTCVCNTNLPRQN